METSNEKLIGLLNGLVEINNDRITGYKHAADETDDAYLKSLFSSMATESQLFKTELSSEVITLGGTPVEGTTNSGKMYRIWMDVKAALTGKNKKAIISSCEFGEDAALETYDQALHSETLIPTRLRELIIEEKQKLLQSHSKIKALRDTVKA